jgi:hypothetical protein
MIFHIIWYDVMYMMSHVSTLPIYLASSPPLLIISRSSRIRHLDPLEYEYRCSLLISTMTHLKQQLYQRYIPNNNYHGDERER